MSLATGLQSLPKTEDHLPASHSKSTTMIQATMHRAALLTTSRNKYDILWRMAALIHYKDDLSLKINRKRGHICLLRETEQCCPSKIKCRSKLWSLWHLVLTMAKKKKQIHLVERSWYDYMYVYPSVFLEGMSLDQQSCQVILSVPPWQRWKREIREWASGTLFSTSVLQKQNAAVSFKNGAGPL